MLLTEPEGERLGESVPTVESGLEGARPGHAEKELVLSVIVPARQEQAYLGECLESLVAQSEPGWRLGEHWELLVVVDDLDDLVKPQSPANRRPGQGTAEIAKGFTGVTVLAAREPLPKGWIGKTNAMATGAEAARGRWLLFTDADTRQQTGVLSRSVVEAERYKVGMLSYGPKQVPTGLLERALLPLVFSEIATAYPVAQVNDPAKRIAFANGQFLLVSAEVYRQVGGCASVATSLDEDVELAFLAKRGQHGLRYRYAAESVDARMGPGFGAVWEGWVRHFAVLVNNTLPLVLWRVLDIALLWGLLLLALVYPTPFVWVRIAFWLFWLRTLVRVYRRAARSNFSTGEVVWSMALGLPLFVALGYTSWFRVRMVRSVRWKGREYAVRLSR